MRGEANALQAAYLAGLQSQTSVYGSTCPVPYGLVLMKPLWIWGANLRQGQSLTGGKKSSGSQTTYVENVDMMLGHNPIINVFRVWLNNSKLGMNFVKLADVTPTDAFGHGVDWSYTIGDPYFYGVLAVTANVTFSQTFNDFGGYGSQFFSGTFEVPLWNICSAGPDPTNQSGYRLWPCIYQWLPSVISNPLITFPQNSINSIPNIVTSAGSPVINIYYAQLQSSGFGVNSKGKGGTNIPIDAVRCGFEPILGSGSEYSTPADYTAQQILYPAYAGIASSTFDMGSSGIASVILPEVFGAFGVEVPYGDCSPADIIEDIMKSGPAQAGTGAAVAYGDIHHGLGCFTYPGMIQKAIMGFSLEPFCNGVTFGLSNTSGNFLFGFSGSGGASSGPITGIADDAGNTWNPLMPGPPNKMQVWYANAIGYGAGNKVGADAAYSAAFIAVEVAGLDTIDGSAVVQDPDYGDAIYAPSITTTNNPGEPALLISFVYTDPGGDPNSAPPVPFGWTRSVENQGPGNGNELVIDTLLVNFPGTYTADYGFIPNGESIGGVLIALKNSQPNSFTQPLGDILDDTSMQVARAQARAYGLIMSLNMDSQKNASDYLSEVGDIMNCWALWSGDKLKWIPKAEQSFIGNGAIYKSPTAAGPVWNLTEDDLVPANEGGPPIKVSRTAQVDAPNLQQYECPSRDNDYNKITVMQPDNGSMALYGTRYDSPVSLNSTLSASVANLLLMIRVREKNIVRNTYSGNLQPKCGILEATDLVSVPIQATMPAMNPGRPFPGTIPIRLTSVSVDNEFKVSYEAEPFIFGLRSPIILPPSTAIAPNNPVTTPAPNLPQYGADPGSVNTPIFMEAPYGFNQRVNANYLFMFLSGASPDYGGCLLNVSYDGGVSYSTIGGPGAAPCVGNAVTGVLTADWPAGTTPDTVNDLSVDLTESFGELDSFTVSEQDTSEQSQFYVSGGGIYPIQFEIGAYAVADLTAPYQYTLKATGGNHLDRNIYLCPNPAVGVGVDHPMGSRFVFLFAPSAGNGVNVAGPYRAGGNPGSCFMAISPTLIGTTLYFKFQAFNTFGGGLQDISTVTAYPYTITGVPSGVNPSGLPPQTFLVN